MKKVVIFYSCLIFLISSSQVQSDVPEISAVDEGIENSELKKDLTFQGINSVEQYKAPNIKAPIRAKREGFVKLSAIPKMMAGMFGSLGKGISSMIGYSQSLGHQMANSFVTTTTYSRPAPTSHRETISRPSHATPNLSYGPWKPIKGSSGNTYKPPQPSPNYAPVIHTKPIQYVPAKPSFNPSPPNIVYVKPKPVFVKPQPVYVEPKPIITYKPSPPSQDSYGTPSANPIQSHSSSDNYGTPVGQVIGKPPPSPIVPSFSRPPTPSISIRPIKNPFTSSSSSSSPDINQLPPFQTNFEPGLNPISNFNPPTLTPGNPLLGTFESQPSVVNSVEVQEPLSGNNFHGHVSTDEGVHKKEEYSNDPGHVQPILDQTLFYKDTKKITFKQKDDGKPHDREEVIALGKFDFSEIPSSPSPGGGGSPHVLTDLLPNRVKRRKANPKKKDSLFKHFFSL